MWTLFYISLLLGLIASTYSKPMENWEIQEMYKKLPLHKFVKFFNRQNFTYKISAYDDSSSKRYRMPKKIRNVPLEAVEIKKLHDVAFIKTLSKNFDPRTDSKWRKCKTLKEIYDQGHCGSCWAVSAASAISDRICIHKKKVVRVSPQDFQCSKCYAYYNNATDSVCNGGDEVCAMEYWKTHGLVTEKCKPYNTSNLLIDNICVDECENNKDYENAKHFGKIVYEVPNDPGQIKAELHKNGPVLAIFTAHTDFDLYKSGIFEHKFVGEEDESGHVVKIIGYGEDNGVEYWIAANSWNTNWGEDGFLRIKYSFDFNFGFVAGLPR